MPRRLQDAWKGYSKEWGLELEETPDVVYQKRVYPDTTSFYLPAMKACMEWVGPERLLIGTDYAHRVGDPEGAIQAINDLGEDAGLTQDQVDMIMGKNAEALYGLPAVL
jgi:aminocarboxymuconate-semialdehyde decarboxylase